MKCNNITCKIEHNAKRNILLLLHIYYLSTLKKNVFTPAIVLNIIKVLSSRHFVQINRFFPITLLSSGITKDRKKSTKLIIQRIKLFVAPLTVWWRLKSSTHLGKDEKLVMEGKHSSRVHRIASCTSLVWYTDTWLYVQIHFFSAVRLLWLMTARASVYRCTTPYIQHVRAANPKKQPPFYQPY